MLYFQFLLHMTSYFGAQKLAHLSQYISFRVMSTTGNVHLIFLHIFSCRVTSYVCCYCVCQWSGPKVVYRAQIYVQWLTCFCTCTCMQSSKSRNVYACIYCHVTFQEIIIYYMYCDILSDIKSLTQECLHAK